MPSSGATHRRIGEIEPGTVELGLGCTDRRVAIDLDIRIAVQRCHGVGDLLFDRCDVLTGDLEIRLGSVIDLTRRKIVSDKRFLRAYSRWSKSAESLADCSSACCWR